ncbi:MAG TPA: cation:proton antiporter [Stellaceae bacterium]|nr:cation:proton antiporter [Stellaceae bacterium]
MNSVVVTTFVIAVFLLLISVVQPVAERFRLPYSVLLAVAGIAFGGAASLLLDTTDLFDNIVKPVVDLPINASVFLVVFLPPLLFHAALTIDLRDIARDAAPILTLAILAVFAAAAAIGISLSFFGVPLILALLLGAVVATTDPAAVIAIFRNVGAPPRLARLLEGESLLNDAAAIVLFSMLLDMLANPGHLSLSTGAYHFITSFLGGVVLGAVAGRAFGAALPLVGEVRTAEVTLSVALPYIVYLLGEHLFDVSGVVAVVSAGLTGGALARIRLRPGGWRYLERVWEQTGFWASSLIFVIASTLVPKLVQGARMRDLGLLLVVVAAALAARAAVLFGVLPLLSALRLSQKISGAYKLAITWGGLRGAVTLALALSVKENPYIDAASKDFVAILATGFVLFTLLVNGLTLRPVIRLLKLDRLSPLNLAIRNKVLVLSFADVREAIRNAARTYRIAATSGQAVVQHYEQRIEELESQPGLEQAISDRDRITVGLIALANRERRIILDHHEQGTVSGAAIERLLHNTARILDAARTEGQAGYERAACTLLGFPRGFRIAHLLHRRLHIAAPLQREVSVRFETLLTRRLTLEELASFVKRRLRPLLGIEIAGPLAEIVARRAEQTAGALNALQLQYPDHADNLERRFLRQSGFQLLSSHFRDLFEEGLIGGELLDNLEREHKEVQTHPGRRTPLDLGLKTKELIGSFEMFSGLDEPELNALVRLFRPRLLVPDERLIRKGERGREMYFISSGAVEVRLPNQRVRLGSGDFVGEMALLSHRPRQADVVSLGYGRVLELAAADFDLFLAKYPRAKTEIERTAAARTATSAAGD